MNKHLTNLLAFSQEKKTNSRYPIHIKNSIGLDEAGRGCLAGPVVAGAVWLAENADSFEQFVGLTDSKKLTENQRNRFELAIKKNSLAWSVGFVWPLEIDRINILQASFKAMSKAYASMFARTEDILTPDKRPGIERILIDGNQNLPVSILLKELQVWGLGEAFVLPQQTVVKGDSKVLAIAAASVLAKVARDRFMQHIDQKYPDFGFLRHKGYGTKAHLEAIKKHGVSPMHRKSFKGCRPQDMTEEKKEAKEVLISISY